MNKLIVLSLFFVIQAFSFQNIFAQNLDPLPSWNEGEAKQRILQFVKAVTAPDSPDFIKEADRIATFDNDGTLWSEKTLYYQLFFSI